MIPPADEEMIGRLVLMGRHVQTEVKQAKRCFVERDVALARDLVRQDDVVDNLNRECFHIALEIGDDPDRREWAMTMLLAARALERIGDNAVDIGEQVAFVVTGLFREFEDASHPGRGDPRPAVLAATCGQPFSPQIANNSGIRAWACEHLVNIVARGRHIREVCHH